MPIQKYDYAPIQFPKDIDFYVLSNEDIGFNDPLVTATNDNYNFALPYPANIDLTKETIVVYGIEFIYQRPHHAIAATYEALIAFISYLKKEFSATFRGTAIDAEDEALKSKFASNIFFGVQGFNVTAAVAVEGGFRQADQIVDALYIPPTPLDLVTPLYIDLVNQAVTVTLATNAVTNADFTNVERVMMRVWYKKRNLTATEKSAMATNIRFAIIDS